MLAIIISRQCFHPRIGCRCPLVIKSPKNISKQLIINITFIQAWWPIRQSPYVCIWCLYRVSKNISRALNMAIQQIETHASSDDCCDDLDRMFKYTLHKKIEKKHQHLSELYGSLDRCTSFTVCQYSSGAAYSQSMEKEDYYTTFHSHRPKIKLAMSRNNASSSLLSLRLSMFCQVSMCSLNFVRRAEQYQ